MRVFQFVIAAQVALTATVLAQNPQFELWFDVDCIIASDQKR